MENYPEEIEGRRGVGTGSRERRSGRPPQGSAKVDEVAAGCAQPWEELQVPGGRVWPMSLSCCIFSLAGPRRWDSQGPSVPECHRGPTSDQEGAGPLEEVEHMGLCGFLSPPHPSVPEPRPHAGGPGPQRHPGLPLQEAHPVRSPCLSLSLSGKPPAGPCLRAAAGLGGWGTEIRTERSGTCTIPCPQAFPARPLSWGFAKVPSSDGDWI